MEWRATNNEMSSIDRNNSARLCAHRQQQKCDITSVLLMRICLKMIKSLHHVCVYARAAVQSGSPGCARAQASLLQFTSITSYNPISHSIDPQNCCSPEPLAFLPIISPPLFFITQRPHPPASTSTSPPHNHPTFPVSEQTQGPLKYEL